MPLVQDPLYGPGELAGLGLEPYGEGGAVDAAVVQADHAEYRTLTAPDLPGVRVVLDGRGVLDPARWPGVTIVTLGRLRPGSLSRASLLVDPDVDRRRPAGAASPTMSAAGAPAAVPASMSGLSARSR